MATVFPDGELPDDLSIDGSVKALRRVPPGYYDAQTGVPNSSCFSKDGDDPGTSVTLWVSDDDLEILTEPHPTFGVIAIRVFEIRTEGLRIAYVDEPGNPNHCEIYGPRSSGKKRRLAAKVRWVKFPEGFPDDLKADHPLWSLPDD